MKLLTDSAKVQTWYRKPLEGCVSSNGKPYSITLKKGTVNKLLVNFFGGGFSWNEETAVRPMTLSRIAGNKEWFYVPQLPNIHNMPEHTLFLHSNSVWDKALVEFMHKMNHSKLEVNNQALDEFHQSLLDVTKRLKTRLEIIIFTLQTTVKRVNQERRPTYFLEIRS